uniref:Uncharacterized protein n=1 Tax=Falco tinnunculus TaxID=100819 RepID=A0A8C4UT20_FALTI
WISHYQTMPTGGAVLEDLWQCLLDSPCVPQNKSPKQCLREGHCRNLQLTLRFNAKIITLMRFRSSKGCTQS